MAREEGRRSAGDELGVWVRTFVSDSAGDAEDGADDGRALREVEERSKDMKLIHTNRHGLELSKRLFDRSTSATESEDTGVKDNSTEYGSITFERKLSPTHTGKVSGFTAMLIISRTH